ncbi:MAG: hypothetical protein DRI88_13760 [Bacteroidetes bacterium]|nr:MAG: hypothetical protein DRI88_13760 [Bacteroidota bacterium]
MGCTQSNDLDLEGRLAVKGSSIHTYLVIEDQKSHKNYKIQNKESFNLMKRQKQTVKIKAKLVKEAIGPGFPAVIEVVEVK